MLRIKKISTDKATSALSLFLILNSIGLIVFQDTELWLLFFCFLVIGVLSALFFLLKDFIKELNSRRADFTSCTPFGGDFLSRAGRIVCHTENPSPLSSLMEALQNEKIGYEKIQGLYFMTNGRLASEKYLNSKESLHNRRDFYTAIEQEKIEVKIKGHDDRPEGHSNTAFSDNGIKFIPTKGVLDSHLNLIEVKGSEDNFVWYEPEHKIERDDETSADKHIMSKGAYLLRISDDDEWKEFKKLYNEVA